MAIERLIPSPPREFPTTVARKNEDLGGLTSNSRAERRREGKGAPCLRRSALIAWTFFAAGTRLFRMEITSHKKDSYTLGRKAFRSADLGRHLVEDGRDALRSLFRVERLRVGPDPERGFRVAGTAWLRVPLENGTARNPQDSGRFTRMVAGERCPAEGTAERDFMLPLVAA
jgi:hypothetical protein